MGLNATQQQLLQQYNDALDLYKRREWQAALDAFNKALDLDPHDGPTRVYIGRCETYLKEPPGEDWDGVFEMKTK
ncbi:MAG: tetratricopeptide repeat protein [Leptospirales bacterium]|jgi:tetratricopeptide (TPR) repeat protein